MGSCSRSDRHKDDSFPMFIPPLPIQQPSHFFSLLLCIQAGKVSLLALLDSSSLHTPQGLHMIPAGLSIPSSRPGPEQIGAAWHRGADQTWRHPGNVPEESQPVPTAVSRTRSCGRSRQGGGQGELGSAGCSEMPELISWEGMKAEHSTHQRTTDFSCCIWAEQRHISSLE